MKRFRSITPGVCIFLIVLTWLVFGQTIRHELVNYDDAPTFMGASDAAKRGLQFAVEQQNAELREELEQNIRLYQTGAPYRDAGLAK